MSNTVPQRHALVFGASGLVGRHVVLALHDAGVRATAASRSNSAAEHLRDWLIERGTNDLPRDIRVDFDGTEPLLGVPALGDVTEIYNSAGSYRFGMSTAEARAANVGSVETIVTLASRLPALKRLVHVSGYRVGGQSPATVPWSEQYVRATYRRLGAYEASKVEADAVLQARADEYGIPWSIVNPSSVIGDSTTGESDQQLGLAANLDDLWHGNLAARPGNARTFVPVVPVDYLARFMTVLPTDPDTAGRSYWILDDRTPPLADLLGAVGAHYGVKVPRARIPVAVIKRLPRRITKAEPETLTFLSTDRYPTETATALADQHGLPMPDVEQSVFAWADYLAAHRFGKAPGRERRFVDLAGIRTFELGDARAPRVILPGLPVNADTWSRVVELAPGSRVVDLPGLGMSGGRGTRDWSSWLAALLAAPDELDLIGHSIGSAAALEAADASPERVARLTLVSPFFLQAPAGRLTRLRPITTAYLRRLRPAALAQRLTDDRAYAPALASSVTDLRRPGTAARIARLLSLTANERWRETLRQTLARYPGDVHVVVGEHDPLTLASNALLESLPHLTFTVIPGAGHHPQLTHPTELAHALTDYVRRTQVWSESYTC